MSYSDLPQDWPQRSLSDPQVARGVLDLCVSETDRRRGGAAVLICGPEGRLRQPVYLDGMPSDPDRAERRLVLEWTTRMCRPMPEAVDQRPGKLVLALLRAEGEACEDDRVWHRLALRVCAKAGVELLGTHVVTLTGVHTLDMQGRAA